MQKLTRIVTLTAALALASGCSYFGVYKRDIPQGNLVTAEMVEQLRPGMTRDDVVSVMGRPLLEAPFDADQWDYVYQVDKAGADVERRRVTLTFDAGQLVDIQREGDFDEKIEITPSEGGPMPEGSSETPQATPNAAPADQR
ncbi:MAG: outer membrane protein assembly factor BamE [Halomonas sp.]